MKKRSYYIQIYYQCKGGDVMQYGLDVSHYQKDIDWKKVKDEGKSFAILKAMYETNHKPDEYFEKNYQGCKANNIELGVYDFFGSKNIENPEKDAKDLLKILNNRPLPWGIWLDLESATLRNIGKNNITRIVEIEADIFRKVGYKVGIYSNKDWYYNVLDSIYLKKQFSFWIARYPKNDNGSIVDGLNPKGYADAWQYSSKGKVPGIQGNVDLDIAYIDSKDLKNPISPTTGFKKVTANTLNIRNESSASSIDMGDLKLGSVIYIDMIQNGFGHFEGWTSMKYLQNV